jgi:hypothetical protein
MLDIIQEQFQIMMTSMETQLDHIQKVTSGLQEEISSLTKERDELGVAPHKLPKGRVLLDVGGHNFATTFETLTRVPDSWIGRMFSGRFPVTINQEDGAIHIDRDGTHFYHILKFLRDPEYKVKMKDRIEFEEYKQEVEFYGLTKAIFGDIDTTIPDNLDWIDNKQIKVHSFSSQLSGFPATYTLDPNQTYWLSESGQTTNQWIVYEFPNVSYINKIMMKVDSFECTAKDWMVQVTEDDDPNGEWNTVKEFQSKSGSTCTTDQFFEDFEVRARYVRLFFVNNWGPGGGSYILVTNIKFFGSSLE